MPKITNTQRTPRGLHLKSKGAFVEIAKGESVEITDADWAAISGPLACLIAEGVLTVEGGEAVKPEKATKGKKAGAEAPVEPTEPPAA